MVMENISRISDSFVERISERQPFSKEKKEVISYGIQVILSDALKFGILFAAAALLGVVPQLLVTMLFIGAVRIFAGGIHLKTWLGCLLISGGSYFAIIAAGIFLPKLLPLNLSIYVLSSAIIFRYAPSDSEFSPVSSKKQRKKLRTITLGMNAVMLLPVLLMDNPYSTMAALSCLVNALILLPLTYRIFKVGYGDTNNSTNRGGERNADDS